jgi:HemK-like putative methylase
MKSQEEQWLLAEKYNGEKSEAFFADCKALALGTPLGYLIGHVPFLDCTIYLDTHPLIPRVETEFWVEQAIKAISTGSTIQPSLTGEIAEPVHILDLCAGSGCIGVAVAKAIPTALVDFSEISAQLLPTITKNIEQNLPSTRQGLVLAETAQYNVYHSNLFTPAIAASSSTRQGLVLGRYDFVLSNPPYIDPAVDRTTESVTSHEPHLALYGGLGGLEVVAQLIASARDHLTINGQLWIEHEPEQVLGIAELAAEAGFNCTSHSDQYGVLRYSILVSDLDFKEGEARL